MELSGYVKANILSNEYIVRQDYNNTIETKQITLSLQDGTNILLHNDEEDTTEITIKTLFRFTENGTIGINQENFETNDNVIWATISNDGIERQTNELINNYEQRTELIDTIVSYIYKYRVRGVNLDFKEVENQDNFYRFIIELAPRLRELGITTNVVLNNSFNEENLIGVVDYIISEKGD